VFDTHIHINLLHPHLGDFLPFELPTDDALLPTISNPKKTKIDKKRMSRGRRRG